MANVRLLQAGSEKGRGLDARMFIVSYNGPASYAVGGDSFVPSDIGLTNFLFVDITGAGGYVCEYDYTNQKIKWYRDAGATAHTHTGPSHNHNLLLTGGQAAGNALQYSGTQIGSTVAGNVTDTAAVQAGGTGATGSTTPNGPAALPEVIAGINLSAQSLRILIFGQ